MTIYIVNSITNEIVARFAAEQPIRQAHLLAEDENRARVEDPGDYDRQTHIYVDGAFVAIPEPTAAEMLVAAKYKAQGNLLVNVNRFIEAKPTGETRYDQNLKLNLMQAAMDAMAAGQAVPAPVTQVRTWISTVQSAYFERKQAIAAAVDQSALDAVDISYGWFEALYGVEGTLQPDPDVYTSAIVS